MAVLATEATHDKIKSLFTHEESHLLDEMDIKDMDRQFDKENTTFHVFALYDGIGSTKLEERFNEKNIKYKWL
jgi:hypothetical protein